METTIVRKQTAFRLNEVLLDWRLYSTLFLHQTATLKCSSSSLRSCIPPYFYIKPQLLLEFKNVYCVVFHLISTSNRNSSPSAAVSFAGCIPPYFYIKPQLVAVCGRFCRCCIPPYFYIKPQLPSVWAPDGLVVFHLISTSNRNRPVRTF